MNNYHKNVYEADAIPVSPQFTMKDQTFFHYNQANPEKRPKYRDQKLVNTKGKLLNHETKNLNQKASI